jgi:5-methylthioadenosine/S-adenosylhomocysteine deaminase
MRFDMIVHNGLLITVNPEFDIIDNGFIAIRDGKIARIEKQDDNTALPESAEYIDAGGGIVLPGLINTHTHLPMNLFRGLADDLPLSIWLNEHIFPAEAKHICPENVKWAAMLACSEMLLSGTTTCCDGYFLEDFVAWAVEASGMRAVLGQGVIDFPAPGISDPADNIAHAAAFVEKWKGKNSRIHPSIFCHSPYTCSAQTLKNAKTAADSSGVLFQIHAAETKQEREETILFHGLSPIAYLDHLGILDKNTLLVHAIWTDDKDIDIIAKNGVKISHNPESNMKLGSGIAPLPQFLQAGITVGLGTDGCASNNAADLFRTMGITAKLHKVNTLDPTVINARTALELATIRGAKAMGLDNDIGSLEIGKKADMIIIDTDAPHLLPMYHPTSVMVYAASGSDVRDVIIDGKLVVKDRRILVWDTDMILRHIEAIAKSVAA